MSGTARLACAMVIVAGMVAAGSPALAAPAASGNCITRAVKFKASEEDKVAQTSSSSYVTVGGTEINITQGAPGCIVVSFTADARAEFPGVFVDVAVYVDGDRCRAGTFTTVSFDFLTTTLTAVCQVAAGARTVQVKYRRAKSEGFVKLRNYTTSVHYLP